jgi:hypothetical protein
MDHAYLEIRSAGEKGRGVFATQAIAKDTRIFKEAPLFILPWQDYYEEEFIKSEGDKQGMTDEKWASFMNLYDGSRNQGANLSGNSGRVFINNSNMSDYLSTGQTGLAIYAECSMINHSCDVNCGHDAVSPTGEVRIFTKRNIEKGEEISISYGDKVEEGVKEAFFRLRLSRLLQTWRSKANSDNISLSRFSPKASQDPNHRSTKTTEPFRNISPGRAYGSV